MDLEPTTESIDSYSNQFVPFYVRKSHVESYSFCPMQFKRQYIDGIEVVENYAMSSGTRFHDFAQKFFILPGNIPVGEWINYIPDSFGIYEWKMAKNFVDYEIHRYNKFFLSDIYQYVPFSMELSLQSTELMLSGTIDRIDWIDYEQTVQIVEYKTSSKFDDASLKRQLALYMILFESLFPYHVVNVRCFNPRLNEYRDYGRPDTKLILKYIGIIRNAWSDPLSIKPKCSPAKYTVCGLCDSIEMAGLYPEAHGWDGEL